MKHQGKVTQVFYNSACPVCDWGIENQRKITHIPVLWHDLHSDNSLCNALNVEIRTARKYLHVLTADGQLHVGIDAFIVLWRAVPSQAWLARLFSYWPVHRPAKLAYSLFANALYGWNRLLRRW